MLFKDIMGGLSGPPKVTLDNEKVINFTIIVLILGIITSILLWLYALSIKKSKPKITFYERKKDIKCTILEIISAIASIVLLFLTALSIVSLLSI